MSHTEQPGRACAAPAFSVDHPPHVAAIDPGTTQSALVVYDGKLVVEHCYVDNAEILDILNVNIGWELLAIEMIASYGMPVGREVFETCVWIGRFIQEWGLAHRLVYRREVKLYLCNSVKAKDPHVRQALIDLVGPQGTVKAPGPTYGLKGDEWAALGVAVTAFKDTEYARAALTGQRHDPH